MADPKHVHLLIFVAPGWCHFSQMQIEELQKNFDNLGTSQSRVHLIGKSWQTQVSCVIHDSGLDACPLSRISLRGLLVTPLSCTIAIAHPNSSHR